MEEKTFLISLPREIPPYLLANMQNSTADFVSAWYAKVPKNAVRGAASRKDALGHLFFKQMKPEPARRLLSAFGPDAEKYAFEVPELGRHDSHTGKRLPKNIAETFQDMELAIEMARARRYMPEECYGSAQDVMKIYRRRA